MKKRIPKLKLSQKRAFITYAKKYYYKKQTDRVLCNLFSDWYEKEITNLRPYKIASRNFILTSFPELFKTIRTRLIKENGAEHINNGFAKSIRQLSWWRIANVINKRGTILGRATQREIANYNRESAQIRYDIIIKLSKQLH